MFEVISEETPTGTLEGISWDTLEGIASIIPKEFPGKYFDEMIW